MKPVLSSTEMKFYDENTINTHHLPSLLLMERAALSVAKEVKNRFPITTPIGIICGTGNNGGDGVAIARILHLWGYNTKTMVVGNIDRISQQTDTEISIATSYGASIKTVNILNSSSASELECDFAYFDECDVIIDAVFGIGLSRPVNDIYISLFNHINQKNAYVIAVDIPSGICSNTGNIMGGAIKANMTVTFAFAKKGHLLSDGYLYSGEIITADVGIYADNSLFSSPNTFIVESDDLSVIPPRSKNANKGTCGKVLVIAGSSDIYGACYLSAKASLVAGSGLVKIYTHSNNRESIQQMLPEAMCTTYSSFDSKTLLPLLEWADTIVIGPGLSTTADSIKIIEAVLTNTKVPVVIDADGINILSDNLNLLKQTNTDIILTPHLKEMSRLCKKPVKEISENMEITAKSFAKEYNCTVVLKNYTTLVSVKGEKTYIIASGNEALSTPGSGDVLSGIIGSLLGQGISPDMAAALGAYIHGQAGTMASKKTGIRGLLASDIISYINI